MNRFKIVINTALFSALLVGCGSNESAEPVEQIVVREPGETKIATVEETPNGNDLVAQGKAAFAACIACHSVKEGDTSTAGPNLFKIVGKKAAIANDFSYSDALKDSGIVWSETSLDKFLVNPSELVPGTTMVAGSVSDNANRKAIIAYLSSMSSE